MKHPLLHLDVRNERDIVVARQRTRHVSSLLGFDSQDQVRVATAVSELARNALRHAGGGTIEFLLHLESPERTSLAVVIADRGPGIPDLDRAMNSPGPAGEAKLGLIAAQRLMDTFHIDSAPARGTTISLGKTLPRRGEPPSTLRIGAIVRELAAHRPQDETAEINEQNRELMRSLEELRLRQEELARLNAELEDTNRGVMALYAELDERATHLRLADETKTRFLSAISHEFRTPVNSILALSKILMHRLDGELSGEQEKQVRYICQAAEQLSTLIDDLLDLRKAEAGKLQMRVEAFSVSDLFGALRGMFKPLAVSDEVALIVEDAAELPPLHTDQGKVAQILRNLISNALKFTSQGSVRVSAQLTDGGESIAFRVTDTGIGIAPEYHRHIFEEFTQVENPLQVRVKGTGLGLPLSQRLAGLLGGGIDLRSAPGAGSTFSLVIPVRLPLRAGVEPGAEDARRGMDRVLVIDDNEIERYALRQFLTIGRYEVVEASGGYEGLRLARQTSPDVIFLDLVMPDVHGSEVLKLLRAVDETRDIPVIVFTSQRLDERDRERLAGASGVLMKNELSRESVAAAIRQVRTASESNHATNA
jgi:signal transduction histidine kinase/CheY-like chemotaxis protein